MHRPRWWMVWGLFLAAGACGDGEGEGNVADGGSALLDAGASGDSALGPDAAPGPDAAQRDAADESRALTDAGSSGDSALGPDAAGRDGSAADAGSSVVEPDPEALALEGYWVWKEVVEDGETTLEITEADMEWRVGPSGWPGCPEGISCTRYGIHLLAFDGVDRMHNVHRVTTGSDTQYPGTYEVEDGIFTFHRAERFSCAHPDQDRVEASDVFARVRIEEGDLWVSDFEGGLPDVAPSRWTVYRPITQEEFHGRYDHPYCGAARAGVESCHPSCESSSVLDEPLP